MTRLGGQVHGARSRSLQVNNMQISVCTWKRPNIFTRKVKGTLNALNTNYFYNLILQAVGFFFVPQNIFAWSENSTYVLIHKIHDCTL